jgi:hypothetical protein
VVATFETLFEQLKRDFSETYDVLRLLSFLDPEKIPLAMLTDGAQMSSQHHSHPSPELRSLVSVLLSPTAFPKILRQLQSLSLVERLSRDGATSLRMHDLVHFITRAHVKRCTVYPAWLESAVSLVCGAFRRVEDPRSPRWWPQCETFLPHVRSLSDVWTDGQGMNSELVTADVRLAEYLNSRGRYDDAERLCKRRVGSFSFRKELGDEDQETLSAFHVLAQIHYNQGRLSEAEETFRHNLAIRKKEPGVDHGITLKTMNSLARVYRRQGWHEEAEELFKQALAIRKNKWGADHPGTLTTMNNLAAVYDSQKRYDEAEELYKHVLACQEKHPGPDHIHTR